MREDNRADLLRLALLERRCLRLTIATFPLGIAWLVMLVYLIGFPHRSVQGDEPIKELKAHSLIMLDEKGAERIRMGAPASQPNEAQPRAWEVPIARAVKSQERKTTMSQQGRILGIGGIFFKSANQQQMQEWYAKHLGLADSGHGVMLPWREKDNPESEQMTVWSIFPGNTRYFEPSPASFMVNYIVDDLQALLDRLAKEGVRIDPKRQDESYGRFAWIYDPDGNKIELWQPHH